MDQKGLDLTINYDPKGDVLYCSFGAPQEAIGVEIDDGVVMRLKPDDESVVGITIADFSKRFLEQPSRLLTFPIKPDVSFRYIAK